MKAISWDKVKRITENQYNMRYLVEYMDGKSKLFSMWEFPPSYINKPYTKLLLNGDPGIILYTPIRN